MGYSIDFKEGVIKDYETGINNIEEYVEAKGISKTTFYNWIKEAKSCNVEFIDITNITNSNNKLELNVNNIKIIIDDNYNEALLLKIIRSLNKL